MEHGLQVEGKESHRLLNFRLQWLNVAVILWVMVVVAFGAISVATNMLYSCLIMFNNTPNDTALFAESCLFAVVGSQMIFVAIFVVKSFIAALAFFEESIFCHAWKLWAHIGAI
jgi:hypothetical protein